MTGSSMTVTESFSVKSAASLTARFALYPSLLYNMARNRLQDNWHWWDRITEHVILGALPFASMLETFRDKGVRAVVTLNEEFEVFISSDQYKEGGFTHLHIPTVDYLFAPPVEDLHRGVRFIAEHAGRGEQVYVHCKAGRGRSTTLVICYLVAQMRMSPEDAYAFVRAKRPQVCLADGQWAAVREFHQSCLEERERTGETGPSTSDRLAPSDADEAGALFAAGGCEEAATDARAEEAASRPDAEEAAGDDGVCAPEQRCLPEEPVGVARCSACAEARAVGDAARLCSCGGAAEPIDAADVGVDEEAAARARARLRSHAVRDAADAREAGAAAEQPPANGDSSGVIPAAAAQQTEEGGCTGTTPTEALVAAAVATAAPEQAAVPASGGSLSRASLSMVLSEDIGTSLCDGAGEEEEAGSASDDAGGRSQAAKKLRSSQDGASVALLSSFSLSPGDLADEDVPERVDSGLQRMQEWAAVTREGSLESL